MAKEYTGTQLLEEKTVIIETESGDTYPKTLYPYLPDASLVDAVNLAAQLHRPLLLMGDPGCGKSILAAALAYEWHPDSFYKNYFEWNIKSNTQAQDGIYTYDPIARLRQTDLDKGLISEEKALKNKHKELTDFYIDKGYLEEGPLKLAIDRAAELHADPASSGNPPVLLIDEIDKASIDFPNDLLLELDKFSYYIKETAYRSDLRSKDEYPFVVITSNDEKELPPAFLRRCIYHYISFPGKEKLKDILSKRNKIAKDDELLVAATEAFMLTRKKLSDGLSNKSVSTAELIDWFEGLSSWQAKEKDKDIAEDRKILAQLKKAIIELPQGETRLPLHQAILKNWDALVRILPRDVYNPTEKKQEEKNG